MHVYLNWIIHPGHRCGTSLQNLCYQADLFLFSIHKVLPNPHNFLLWQPIHIGEWLIIHPVDALIIHKALHSNYFLVPYSLPWLGQTRLRQQQRTSGATDQSHMSAADRFFVLLWKVRVSRSSLKFGGHPSEEEGRDPLEGIPSLGDGPISSHTKDTYRDLGEVGFC